MTKLSFIAPIGQGFSISEFARVVIPATLVAMLGVTRANSDELNPDISVVLDGLYIQNETALGHGGPGFTAGHNELSLSAPIDDQFSGRLTTVFESHESETEIELEEAFILNHRLGYGFGIKLGRFLSDIGYLNSQHTHADAFSTRPAVYRALLSSHYFDDGVQLQLTMPTDIYWRLSLEAMQGSDVSEADDGVGVITFATKFGDDLSESQSWQVGFSYVHNRDPLVEMEEDESDEEHDHAGHSHDVGYYGKSLYAADLVWKWAPKGNNRQQQLSLSGEYFYVDELNRFATESDEHEGWYAAAVWQFNNQWSTGVRYGEVDLRQAHGDHFHSQSLEESDWMLSYAHSHFSTIRFQYSLQSGQGFEVLDDSVSLQFVMSFGEHGSHAF